MRQPKPLLKQGLVEEEVYFEVKEPLPKDSVVSAIHSSVALPATRLLTLTD